MEARKVNQLPPGSSVTKLLPVGELEVLIKEIPGKWALDSVLGFKARS